MARRCGPNHPCGGMQKGLFNSFFGSGDQVSPPSKFTIGVIGDSNANGASSVITTCAIDTLFNFNGTTYDEITTQSVSNGNPTLGSIWQGFATAYKSAFNKPVYLINGAKGGTYYSNDVAANSWGSSGTLRSAFLSKVSSGLTAINKGSLDLIIVNLGVNDVRNSYTGSTITTAIADFYLWLTNNFPTVPILVIQVGRSETGLNGSLFYLTRKNIIDAAITYTNVNMCCSALPFAFISGYEADNLHYNQTTQNTMGGQMVQWILNSSYSKWGRSIISSMFDIPNNTRKALINAFAANQAANTNLFRLEGLFVFKTGVVNNTLLDWSFIGYGATGGAPSFTSNDSFLFDGVDDYFATGIQGDIYNMRSSLSNFIVGAKVKQNLSSGIVALFGATDAAGSTSIIQNPVRYRAGDATLSAGTETVFAGGHLYTVRRNGTTKELLKDKVSNASTTQANTGAVDTFAQVVGAINSISGVGAFINATLEYYFYAGNSSFDHSSFYDDMETLIAGW